MRKASREMPAEWAIDVMKRAPYITVSFTRADGSAYGVPLSMACTTDNTWYFHCAPEGDKLDALRAHHEVCLTAVSKCQPTVGPHDNSFTLQYQSAIAFGHATIVTDEAEKIEALRAICQRYMPYHMQAFDEAIARSLHRTTVVRVDLSTPPTGKRKQYDNHGNEMTHGRMA
ncbi:MAG: pyridoxamine 5'-phosphate oxidase family protein [Bacteroidales bacterium]|nr:pyridoxamine 5'-phosphate oxidase family protein [Bacteroidales bacterium]